MFLRENVVGEEGHGGGREGEGRDLLGELIEVLMGEAEGPPRVVKGVSDEFLEGGFFFSPRLRLGVLWCLEGGCDGPASQPSSQPSTQCRSG